MRSNEHLQTQKTNLTKTKGASLSGTQQIVGYSGPIPHPDILKGLADIDPSFPNRIISIAENHAKTEDEAKMKIVKTNSFSLILGQCFSFLFGIGGLAACVFMAMKGFAAGAVISGIVVITQCVVAGVANFKK